MTNDELILSEQEEDMIEIAKVVVESRLGDIADRLDLIDLRLKEILERLPPPPKL